MSQPLKTFICYAHEDRAVVEGLKEHLFIFEKKGLLQIWSDGKILAGHQWDKSIKIQLEQAEIILLFISVSFINSEYIEKTELKEALQRHRDNKARLIPIIVRPCHWTEYFDIGQFQALPAHARPILSSHFQHIDEAFFEIAAGVKKTAEELLEKKITEDTQAQAEAIARKEADAKAAQIAAAAKLQKSKDEAAWKVALQLNTLEAYEDYAEKYSLHEVEAHECIGKLEAIAAQRRAEQKAKEKAAQKEEEEKRAKTAAGKAMAVKEVADPFADLMIQIKGGTFDMGDTFGDDGSTEQPVHKVVLRDFELCKYPVTQAEWKTIMGDNPSSFKGDDLPVEHVSWNDAQGFIKKLNEKTGKKYRLPSEAEWEYAAREGGKKVRFGNGKDIADPKEMNFNGTKNKKTEYSVVGEYREKTTPVSQFKPNALGLHDMSGNVWEWCQDVWHDSYKDAPDDGSDWNLGGDSSRRVVRGGFWYDPPGKCCAASRGNGRVDFQHGHIGFRLAR